MADRIDHFEVLETAGGSPGLYTLTRLQLKPGLVTAIVVHMPGGHAGKTGVQLAYSQQQIIPEPPSIYYRGNKRTIRKELSELFPANGDWWCQTFNAGRYDHTFHIDFEVDALVTGTSLLPPVILIPLAGEAFPTSEPTAAPTFGSGTSVVPV